MSRQHSYALNGRRTHIRVASAAANDRFDAGSTSSTSSTRSLAGRQQPLPATAELGSPTSLSKRPSRISSVGGKTPSIAAAISRDTFVGSAAPTVVGARKNGQGTAKVSPEAVEFVRDGNVATTAALTLAVADTTAIDQCNNVGTLEAVATVTCTITVVNTFTYNPDDTANQRVGDDQYLYRCSGSRRLRHRENQTSQRRLPRSISCTDAGIGGPARSRARSRHNNLMVPEGDGIATTTCNSGPRVRRRPVKPLRRGQ